MNENLTLHRAPGTIHYNNNHSNNTQSHQNILQRLFSKDKWTRLAIIWSILQFITISTLEAFVMNVHWEYVKKLQSATALLPLDINGQPLNIVPNAKALLVYQVLFICAQLFQLYLCADAILNLSVIQLVATALFNTALFGYSIMQFNQAGNILSSDDLANLQSVLPNLSPHPTRPYELAVMAAMAVFVAVWIPLAFKLYKVFGWSIFKEMGADISLRKHLQLYHIFLMLLKLDVFFFFGFDLQFLVLVLIDQKNDYSNTLIHAAVTVPLSVILLTIAYLGVRYENKILAFLTMAGMLGAIAYLVSKLVDIWTTKDRTKYLSSKKSLTFFVSLTLIMSIATFFVTILNYQQFGKGLQDKLRKRGSSSSL